MLNITTAGDRFLICFNCPPVDWALWQRRMLPYGLVSVNNHIEYDLSYVFVGRFQKGLETMLPIQMICQNLIASK